MNARRRKKALKRAALLASPHPTLAQWLQEEDDPINYAPPEEDGTLRAARTAWIAAVVAADAVCRAALRGAIDAARRANVRKLQGLADAAIDADAPA